MAPEKDHLVKHEQTECVPVTFVHDSMINLVKTQDTNKDEFDSETAESFKRSHLTPHKQGYTPERHPTKKQTAWKPSSIETNDICTSLTDDKPATEEPRSKSFKEMIDAIHKSEINSSDSDYDFDEAFKPLDNTDLYFSTLDEPTEGEKQYTEAKCFLSDSFDYSHGFQMVRTQELWEYNEFDRSLTPKAGNKHDHLEQVRRFILKNGFQEPLIITCDLHSGKAYISEGNHRPRVAIKEGIKFVPCHVIPHWLPPNGSYKNLDIDFSTLTSSKQTILPEHLGLTVAQTGLN